MTTPDDHIEKEMTAAAAVGMQMIGACRIGDLELASEIGLSLGEREGRIVSVWLALAVAQLLGSLDESDGFDGDTLLAAWGNLVARRGLEAEGR